MRFRKRTDEPPQASPEQVRALELELGIREWDDRDVSEAIARLHTQIRYVDPDPEWLERYVERERRRLTADAPWRTPPATNFWQRSKPRWSPE